MPFTDWHLGVPTPHVQQEYSFVMATTVADLSYTPSEEEKSRDAAQFVATGRKSWKTLKGKGEAVWPPLLEAALLEALERYRPENTGAKSDKVMGRFPMRNRFISDYIFEATGKRRTPKQVGSRLQQLRDTCKKEHILQLISHRNTPEPSSAGSQTDSSHGASPSPRIESRHHSSSHNYVHVKITLQTEPWPAPVPSIHLIRNSPSHPQIIQLAPSAYPLNGLISHKSASPNILSYLSKTMEFRSQCALLEESTFTVYYAGSRNLVHKEDMSLMCISSPVHSSGWLYRSELVSEFWGTICSSQDLSSYVIVQTVKPANTSSIGNSSSFDGSSTHQISIVYKFDTSAGGSRRSPLSTSSLYAETIPLMSQMHSATTTMASDLSHSLSTISPSSTWQIPDTDDQLSNNCLLPLSGRYRQLDPTSALASANSIATSYAQPYQSPQPQPLYAPIPKLTLVNHDASDVLYAPVPMSYHPPPQLDMYYS
ncbi:hypothetical protein BDN70DRAFT_880094 [Pholiota conissans]|uniref:TEA domain-containing protein n=1 Tax=Pholiota conissans TaxID=109636 RepID=A0A9P6CSK5_9AGAR|nr:hypothetical protein BDN70DRAFT_880094 [Pholiota conissans]